MEVSGLKWDQLLSSGQVLPSECVSELVELVGNLHTSPALRSSIISLLTQLACDDESREMLHSSYNLTSTLASVIHRHSATPGEPLVLQCLQVLQKVTYNTRVFHSTNYIHELITFLMTNIQSHNEDIIMPCLGLMANLCRDNHSVQSHIKSLDNVKPFYRTLINFLAHNSLTVVVFALSILASLTLNEKVGEKLFDARNIYQTFQLVFNIIVNGDGTPTRNYSVDLLVDLLKSPKIADCLTRIYMYMVKLKQVLELLLAMCSVSGLRSLLCEVVFRPVGPKLKAKGHEQGAGLDGGRKVESGLALVQWLSSPVEGAESCSLQALQLLNELLEEALGADSVSECVLSFVEMLLPVLLGLLNGLDPAQGDAHLRKHCQRITHVTGLLLNILHMTRSVCCLFVSVESLFSCCHSNNPLTCLPPGSDNDLSCFPLCVVSCLQARKLGCLLKEAERRCEDLQGELGSQVLEEERSKADMEELLRHNARLQQDSEKHQVLKGAYNALLNRSDSVVVQHVDERFVLFLSGLRDELRAEEKKGKEKDQEKRDLEETVDVLRKELDKMEQARKEASSKVSSLELQKSQLEAKLNKHSEMIAMIHSLSSGKMKNDVNLSL
eukprot:superscaffoldBa00006982_g22108